MDSDAQHMALEAVRVSYPFLSNSYTYLYLGEPQKPDHLVVVLGVTNPSGRHNSEEMVLRNGGWTVS